MSKTPLLQSTRQQKPTGKQILTGNLISATSIKLWLASLSDTDHSSDETNKKVSKRKMKKMEDRLKKSQDSSKFLKAKVKALKRQSTIESPPTLKHAHNDSESSNSQSTNASNSSSDSSSDIAHRSDDSKLLFLSPKVSMQTYMFSTTWARLIFINRYRSRVDETLIQRKRGNMNRIPVEKAESIHI